MSVEGGFERFCLMLPRLGLALLGAATASWLLVIVVRMLLGRPVSVTARRGLLSLGPFATLFALVSPVLSTNELTRVATRLNANGLSLVSPDSIHYQPNIAVLVAGLIAWGIGMLLPRAGTTSSSPPSASS